MAKWWSSLTVCNCVLPEVGAEDAVTDDEMQLLQVGSGALLQQGILAPSTVVLRVSQVAL